MYCGGLGSGSVDSILVSGPCMVLVSGSGSGSLEQV